MNVYKRMVWNKRNASDCLQTVLQALVAKIKAIARSEILSTHCMINRKHLAANMCLLN